MSLRVLDSQLETRLIAERRSSGLDRYDEVWNGEYVMSPLANNEHQKLAGLLTAIFTQILGVADDVWCLAGANVSDQETDWTKNYRCPDVVVVLPGSRAQNRGTHWFGGPDLVVEIVSEGDASYEKTAFYEKIGVREVLLVDRDPWMIELHRLDNGGKLTLVASIDLRSNHSVRCEVLDAELTLFKRSARPAIQIRHSSGQVWHT